jgi:nucleoside-diphosphate-sugar epimerase
MTDGDPAVLVSGPTGFIGREIVRRLVAEGRRVVALARPLAGQPAAARVRAAIGPLPPRARLTVVAAELAQLAAAPADLAWLRETVVTVIHCAADTRFFPDELETFRASHVNAPVTLLKALAGGRLRHFAHMSTAFVCGRRNGHVLEDDGDVGQRFHNPYERAKLDAELTLTRAAAASGIDVRVLRPSIVVGTPSATAGGVPSNLFFAVVRLLARLAAHRSGASRPLRLPGAPAAPFNVVPVEYVAAAAVALAEHPNARHGTFHVVMSEPPTQATVLAMISDVLGLEGVHVIEALRISDDASPLERRLARVLGPYTEYLMQDVRFDNRRARSVLDTAGVPEVTLDADGVKRLVGLALASAAVGS